MASQIIGTRMAAKQQVVVWGSEVRTEGRVE